MIVTALGVIQGLVLGQGVVEHFPRIVTRARFASALLFAVFAANAIVRTINFATPEKIAIPQALASATPNELVSTFLKVMDINADAGAIIGLSLTIMIFLLLKLTTLQAYSRAFVITINITMMIIIFLIRLSDYKPDSFEIILYMLYQGGITGGIIWGTRRKLYSKELRFRYFRQRWTGGTEA